MRANNDMGLMKQQSIYWGLLSQVWLWDIKQKYFCIYIKQVDLISLVKQWKPGRSTCFINNSNEIFQSFFFK